MLIPHKILKAASQCAATEKSRLYSLESVQLKRLADGRCQAVAMDTKIALLVRWTEDNAAAFPSNSEIDPSPTPGFSTMVSAKEAAVFNPGDHRRDKPILANVALCETQREDGCYRAVAFGKNGMQLANLNAVSGNYPNIVSEMRRATSKKPRSVSIDCRLLEKVLTAIRMASTSTDRVIVRFTFDAEDVEVEGEPNWRMASDLPLPVVISHSEEGREILGLVQPVVQDNSLGYGPCFKLEEPEAKEGITDFSKPKKVVGKFRHRGKKRSSDG